MRARRAYLVHAQAEPSPFPSLSIFRGKRKVDFDDPDIIHLRAYRIHAVRGRSDEDLLMSTGRDADTHEKIDNFVRPNAEEDVV